MTDPDYGMFDNVPLNAFAFHPHTKKAATKYDPDTPNNKEVLSGPHKDKFLEAMSQEIENLEEHGTWNVIRRSSLPEGANVLSSTWAFKIKRTPCGELRKFQARFCIRGDQ